MLPAALPVAALVPRLAVRERKLVQMPIAALILKIVMMELVPALPIVPVPMASALIILALIQYAEQHAMEQILLILPVSQVLIVMIQAIVENQSLIIAQI